MDSQSKLSYKSVVCDKHVSPPVATAKGLSFVDWEDLPFHSQPDLFKCQVGTSTSIASANTKQLRREATYRKEVLLDVLNEMALLTDYVRECFGCKGVGDELKLEDVLNALETSITVEYHSDTDVDFVSEEDDS